jgi:hypothetical protein
MKGRPSASHRYPREIAIADRTWGTSLAYHLPWLGVDLSYIIYRACSESVKHSLHSFTEHLGGWLKFPGGRRRTHRGAAPHPGNTASVSKAQKRQSLKEALPMWSDSGSNMFRLLRSVQLGMVSVAFGVEALPLSQTLQVAYLLMFATQLLM